MKLSTVFVGTALAALSPPALSQPPLKLKFVGNPAASLPLGPCEGDCDGDRDCAPGLVCFERERDSDPFPPGCARGTVPQDRTDYCYDPATVPSAAPTLSVPPTDYVPPRLKFVRNPPRSPLRICEGDCDDDDDCQGDLRCFQRDDRSQRVPGCSLGGEDDSNWDFCYDVNGTYPPTEQPTGAPSPSPSVSKQPSDKPSANPSAGPTPWQQPKLEYLGNPRGGYRAGQLEMCQGDCDNDEECEGTLKCFQRENLEKVPGCSLGGNDRRSFDVCYDEFGTYPPTTSPTDAPSATPSISDPPSKMPSSPPTRVPKLRNRGINPNRLLGQCEGDCDTDADCKPHLTCFRRSMFYTHVPGCKRGGDDYIQMDVCYLPFPSTQPTKAPTHRPTKSPKPTDAPSSSPTDYPEIEYVGNPADNLGLCQGDCDEDVDCRGDLVCFQRDSRRDPIPGCLVEGDDRRRSFDVCVQIMPSASPTRSAVPTDLPTTSRPTRSKEPTPDPTARPTYHHFAAKVQKEMRYFQLKQYWRRGYFWQESTSEERYCAETRSSRTGDKIDIQRCSSGKRQQRWRFYRDNRFMIESYYRTGLCIGIDGIWLTLRGCNMRDPTQRWNLVGKSDRKFEWQMLRQEDQCVSNEHHPSSGEGLKVMRCRTAKKEETNYWTVYD
mmetsp:Transcript_17971/g.40829  ORF Transcript_17971/g.40829 Transcript_17971/m.40829 type:complete len:660 (-) Transcript_17971:143-2122(-)